MKDDRRFESGACLSLVYEVCFFYTCFGCSPILNNTEGQEPVVIDITSFGPSLIPDKMQHLR